jgi:xanthine/uracil permease
MEFMVNTFVKNDVIAVAISVLLGLLSSLVFGSGVMMMVGALVGLIVGIMLRVMYLNTIGDDVKYWN